MVARVIGLAGWSGSGKTRLLTRILPVLAGQGLKVSTIKRAHHTFEVDLPGKDSYEHRRAGASEVIISSAGRWAQVHELGEEPELTLAQLLRRMSPCDLIVVEGFKRERHPKLEVFRASVGKRLLHPEDSRIVAIASDQPVEAAVPEVSLDDVAAVARLVYEKAEPLDLVLAALEGAHGPAL